MSPSFTSSGATSILPASTFERSRMSLIRSSRSEPAAWIVFAKSTCFSVRLPSALSPSSFARISSELSVVRGACELDLAVLDLDAPVLLLEQVRLLFELLVRLLQLFLLLLQQLLGRAQCLRLLLELRVRTLQLFLLR